MITQELINFIKHQQSSGKNRDEIAILLRANRWDEKTIDQGFRAVTGNTSNVQVVPSPRSTSELPGVGELLTQSWHVFISRFWILAGINICSILLMIPFVVVVVLFFGIAGSRQPGTWWPTDLTGNLIVLVGAMIFILGLVITQFWSQAAYIFAIKDRSEKIGVKESYRRALNKVKSVAWVGLLSGAVVTGGFLLFIVPGIIFAIWFLFSQYVVITENKFGVDALLTSREYVRGKWWEITGRWMILFIFFWLLFPVLKWLIDNVLRAEPISDQVISFLSFILSPLFIIYLFTMYESAKASTAPIDIAAIQKNKTSFTVVAVIGFLIAPLILLLLQQIKHLFGNWIAFF